MSKKIELTDGTALTIEELATPDRAGNPRVMTLLREKKLNPEDVPEKLLILKDCSGMSVLDVCIERFREPVWNRSEKRYIPRIIKRIWSLPVWFRCVEEILTIVDGYSIPAVIVKLLDIFRVFYNYTRPGNDKMTPAMRIGMANGIMGLDDILYFKI